VKQDANKNSYMRSFEEIHRRNILQIILLTVRRQLDVDSWTEHFVVSLLNDQHMRQGTGGFINVFQVYPNMFRQVVAILPTSSLAHLLVILQLYEDRLPILQVCTHVSNTFPA
jgi:hypothetical protein